MTHRLTVTSQDNLGDGSLSPLTDEDLGFRGAECLTQGQPRAEDRREPFIMNWPHENVYKCEKYNLGRAERFGLNQHQVQ